MIGSPDLIDDFVFPKSTELFFAVRRFGGKVRESICDFLSENDPSNYKIGFDGDLALVFKKDSTLEDNVFGGDCSSGEIFPVGVKFYE